VQADYFAQDQYRELDPRARLLDDLSSVANGKTVTELRSLLGCFLFSADDVFKTIGVLSGGERNRYALARLLLNPSNFLLLDEPTNHLDLRAKDVLLESLQEFSGTLVFVSHDRYFIDRLASKVFEIENGEVRVFAGNYEDYLWRKQQPAPLEAPVESAPEEVGAEAAPDAARSRKVNPIKLRQLEEQAGRWEERVAGLENAIAQLEASLAVFTSPEDYRRKSGELDELRASLQAALQEWERATVALEEARA
jgi:ATP-binding cassette subfamily F protein 3